MTRSRGRLLAPLPLALLLWAVSPAAADDTKPAGKLPEGARLRLGAGHFHHAAVVSGILPLPGGKRLLTLADDSKVRVWDVAAERELLQVAVDDRPNLLVCAVAPDGKALAAATWDGQTFRTWSLADGKELQAFPALPANFDQRILSLDYAPDGKALVSSHQDRSIRIWDPATGKELRRFKVPGDATPDAPASGRACFLPDGKGLALIEGRLVRLLSAEDGKELRRLGGHTAPVAALALSPDGKRLATVGGDRAARVWDLATGQAVARLPLPDGGGSELAFDPDGKVLTVLCGDRTARLFDAGTHKQLSRVDFGPGYGRQTFALARDGKVLYVSSVETVLHGYDTVTGKELLGVTGHVGGVQDIAWSPDGKQLATSGAGDCSIIVWDAAAAKLLHRLPGPGGGVSATHLQFALDGRTVLSYSNDGRVRAWDPARGRELRSFVASPPEPESFAFSPDGKLAAVTAADRQVRVWDVAAGKELRRLRVPQGTSRFYRVSLTFAGDGRTLVAFLPEERRARRWDVVAGKELSAWEGASLHFGIPRPQSGDPKSFVVLGVTPEVREWATGAPRQTFALPRPEPAPGAKPRPFFGTVGGALSPDGRTLATLTSDGTLRFWDTGSGKVLAERHGLWADSLLLAFAPDGQALANGRFEPGALLWDVPGPAAQGRPVPKGVTADTVGELWKDLSGADPARAWQAILNLAAAPKEAVPFLRKRLKAAALGAGQIAQLIADLDAEEFQRRESATEELLSAGQAAEEAMKKALANKPSTEAKQRLESILSKLKDDRGPSREVFAARAIEVLEKAGTPEARQVLEEIAKGGDSPLTAEARSAWERLRARSAAP